MAADWTRVLTEGGGVIQASRVLVIGVGNAYRHDDAAGLVVARHLKDQTHSSCEVHEHVGEGTGLMELWKCASALSWSMQFNPVRLRNSSSLQR